jgi:putative thioredoxin
VYTIHGAQPDVQLRSILDRYVARPSDALRPEALRAYQEGDKGKAFDIFAQAYHADPANTRIVIDHAKLLILDNQFEAVLKLLTTLPRAVQDMPEIALLSAHAQFMHVAANAPLKEILIRQINVHPEDMEARYQLSALLLIEDDYEGAMEQLLEIVRRDRTYKMDAGRKGLLAVFTILGENHDLVARYRSLLYQALQP